MTQPGSSDLFSLDNDPNVMAARARYRAAAAAVRRASPSYRRRRQIELQTALHELLQIETIAERELIEAGHVKAKPKENAQPAPKSIARQDDFITRERGDDTNYRPLLGED